MRRCSSSHAPGLVTRQQIASDLMSLGVAPGDTVMLHAAVGAIGWVVGGPDQVLHGVLDALGERGTLMMYVGWDGSPYDVTIGLPELPPQFLEVWPVYDPATAHAVRSWGVLGEILRTWPGARRSAHPDSSFAAVGSRAEELVRDHPLQYGMGEGSPLAKLCEANGKVLLLGAPLSNVTLLHHAEHIAEVPGKEVVRYWAPFLQDGAKEWVRIEEFSTEECLPWFGPGDMFEAILRDYIQGGSGVVGSVGAARSYLFDASDLSHFAVDWIEERLRNRSIGTPRSQSKSRLPRTATSLSRSSSCSKARRPDRARPRHACRSGSTNFSRTPIEGSSLRGSVERRWASSLRSAFRRSEGCSNRRTSILTTAVAGSCASWKSTPPATFARADVRRSRCMSRSGTSRPARHGGPWVTRQARSFSSDRCRVADDDERPRRTNPLRNR